MGYPIYTQDQLNQNLDEGIDPPVITTEKSQAPTVTYTGSSAIFDETGQVSNLRRNEETGELYDATGLYSTAQTAPGVAAPLEDRGVTTRATVEAKINAANPTGSLITPRPNTLNNFASYTYSLSLYILTLEQTKALNATQKIDTSGWSLLMQSGGASSAQSAAAPGTAAIPASATPGRNKYFTLDYYMDDLVIDSAYAQRGSSITSEISFKVIEPNGITLLRNLYYAAQDLYKDNRVTAKDVTYAMVIKFYGYDSQGNLVTASSSSGSNVAITKYFPFKLASVEFKVANRAVEYEIKGATPGDLYGKSSALGSIPHRYQLVGVTVDDVLNGNAAATNATAGDPDDRAAQNKASANTGSPTKAPPLTRETVDTIGATDYGPEINSLGIGA